MLLVFKQVRIQFLNLVQVHEILLDIPGNNFSMIHLSGFFGPIVSSLIVSCILTSPEPPKAVFLFAELVQSKFLAFLPLNNSLDLVLQGLNV